MNRLKFLFLALFLSASTLYAQDNSTYNFLKLDVSAKASALGGSYTSATGDVNGIFYNPASLSTLQKSQVSVGFFKYLLDVNSGSAAYSMKLKDKGFIGAGIRYINYGSFEGSDEQFNDLGTFSANDLALSLGYANNYSSRISYGVNLKLIYSSIESYNSIGVAGDFGVLYNVPESMFSAGISLLNVGGQLKSYNDTKENLPLDLRIGVQKKLELSPITISASFNNLASKQDKFADRFKYFTVGGEFAFNDNFNLRVGYNNQLRQDLKAGSSSGLAGFSGGLGIKVRLSKTDYLVDYAFNSLGKLGSTHRINIGFDIN